MRTTFTLILISMMLLSSAPSIADDEYVTFAKSLTANKYDHSLPPVPVERWLTSILPHGIVASWGNYVTDCGEQTGVQAIDKDRDMPMCAEIEFKENGRSVGYLLLFIGTDNRGVSSTNTMLFQALGYNVGVAGGGCEKHWTKSPVVDCDKFVIRNTKNHKGTYRIGRIDRNHISKSYSVVNGKSDRRSRA